MHTDTDSLPASICNKLRPHIATARFCDTGPSEGSYRMRVDAVYLTAEEYAYLANHAAAATSSGPLDPGALLPDGSTAVGCHTVAADDDSLAAGVANAASA
jgi:hypothetical protein